MVVVVDMVDDDESSKKLCIDDDKGVHNTYDDDDEDRQQLERHDVTGRISSTTTATLKPPAIISKKRIMQQQQQQPPPSPSNYSIQQHSNPKTTTITTMNGTKGGINNNNNNNNKAILTTKILKFKNDTTKYPSDDDHHNNCNSVKSSKKTKQQQQQQQQQEEEEKEGEGEQHHHELQRSPETSSPPSSQQTAAATTTTTTTEIIATTVKKPIRLIKSTRLKGYMTLTLAAFIHLEAARNSSTTKYDGQSITIVPSTHSQKLYAQITALFSMIGTCFLCYVHFDRITTLQNRIWIPLFFHTNGTSIYEGCIIIFYTLWWSIATGIATSVNGIAGDGKGQYSLYYSTWACCLTSFWLLERWFVASGWSSFNSFIASWPNRSPAWICIMILSFFTLIWYLDLWQNHSKLNRESEEFIIQHFEGVNEYQWQWLITVSVCTFCPAVFFVAVELFRETKSDGSIAIKSSVEALIEGVIFGVLTFAWIATVMIATTPTGAASLIGNSYFFTWVMSIFVFEGFIWYIHDRRKATYQALKEKQEEYRQRQEQVLQEAKEIQRKYEERENFGEITPMMNQDSDPFVNKGVPPQSRRGFSNEFIEARSNRRRS